MSAQVDFEINNDVQWDVLSSGSIMSHGNMLATDFWRMSESDKAAKFVSEYTAVQAKGDLARAVRGLLWLGVAKACHELSVFENLSWEEALGFPSSFLRVANIKQRLPEFIFSMASVSGAQSSYKSDPRDDVLLIFALTEAKGRGVNVEAALQFVITLGYSCWKSKSLPPRPVDLHCPLD